MKCNVITASFMLISTPESIDQLLDKINTSPAEKPVATNLSGRVRRTSRHARVTIGTAPGFAREAHRLP